MIDALEEVKHGELRNAREGKHFTWVLKNGLGIPEGKAFQVEAAGGTNLPGTGSSFCRTGSRCPEAMVGAGYRWCSERRKGLAIEEAKLKGALTSRLFILFLYSLPNLSRGTLGDIG